MMKEKQLYYIEDSKILKFQNHTNYWHQYWDNRFQWKKITFLDIGGAYGIKKLRNNYLPYSDIIIFLIDSSESLSNDNFGLHYKDNFKELQECINLIEDKQFLIAITKIDIRKSGTLDIIEAYQLQNLFQRKNKFGIIECSSFTSQGIKEILFGWVVLLINNKFLKVFLVKLKNQKNYFVNLFLPYQ